VRIRIIPALVLVLALALPGPAQELQPPKVHGYLSLDFFKGQADSPYSKGSIEGLGAGLFFLGDLSDKFSYTLEARFKSDSRVEIEQAWVAFTASATFRLTAGAFLVPFGKYNLANRPYETRLILKPLILERAYPDSWRELGAQASGKLAFLNAAVYIGNGLAESASVAQGQQFKDNNANKGWGGRLSLQPGQGMDVGVSYYLGKYDALDQRNLKLVGADASWTTRDFQVLAEYIKAENHNPAPFAKGVVEGYFVQLAFNYQNFFPVVSYQRVRQDDPFHGPGWAAPDIPGEGLFARKARWAVGLAYLLTPNFQIKAEYDFNTELEGPTLKDNLLIIQSVVNF
jgi:hypothetical protein